MSATILMIEDNIHILKTNRKVLTAEGYFVLEAPTLSLGRLMFEEDKPDLIILDLMLPDGDGLDFCREVRGKPGGNIPILMLSAKDEKPEIKEGLDTGADDYLTKPYDFDELTARVKALLRRSAKSPGTIRKGAITLNLNSNRAYVNGEDIKLSSNIGISLLKLFIQEENKTLSADYIYKELREQPMMGDDSAVRNAVYSIRNKIKGSGYTITTERGTGYRFEKD